MLFADRDGGDDPAGAAVDPPQAAVVGEARLRVREAAPRTMMFLPVLRPWRPRTSPLSHRRIRLPTHQLQSLMPRAQKAQRVKMPAAILPRLPAPLAARTGVALVAAAPAVPEEEALEVAEVAAAEVFDGAIE